MEKQEMKAQEERKQLLLLYNNSFASRYSKTFLFTPTMLNFFKGKLQRNRRCSVKKVFQKASQNLQENTPVLSLFISANVIKNDSGSGVFL